MQEFDIAVIGAGSAGPKAARTAARLGAKVVIFEEALIGGECLYTGCVPSKALIHSATLWNRIGRAAEFGLPALEGKADFGAVMKHARRTVEVVGAGSAVESFARQGIATVCERAVFVDANTVETKKTHTQYRAKQFILCTGSRPAVPPIPGLEEAGYDTNQTVFDYTELPRRMVVLGGGPIGCELGQVFARFGCEVTLLHNGPRILARDDHDAAEVLHEQLERDGLRILTILVSTGRRSNVEGLNLGGAGVRCEPGARLKTNAHMQTNVPHIWAAGDVTTELKFTHVCSYEGAVAALNAVANLRGKDHACAADYRVIPRVTYTDPEIASVGLTPALARMTHHGEDAIEVARFPFEHLDRAIIEGDTQGFVQIVSLKGDGTILGAQIAGAHAGSLISEVCLAMRADLPVSEIALTMHAYPTFPEAVEAAAYETSHAPLSPCIPREMGDPEEPLLEMGAQLTVPQTE
jgi:pyruvate/2-oxoglutarate dehydrogenase complex dihydrolipoamide dehydrogenase (E3) component